ncbi:hypothetical protein NM65012_2184 [Neisseria meningitidis 65012]|nr:hypothetical protein NM65012_2184 [Neisseria meningitidis 65012]
MRAGNGDFVQRLGGLRRGVCRKGGKRLGDGGGSQYGFEGDGHKKPL